MKTLYESLLSNTRGGVKDSIEEWCKKNLIPPYEISGDLTINGNIIYRPNSKITNLYPPEGAKWGDIDSFYCYNCSEITSLEGAPEKIRGGFNCSHCKNLTSLEGAPKGVGGDFDCSQSNSLFNKEYVSKLCKVKGNISV